VGKINNAQNQTTNQYTYDNNDYQKSSLLSIRLDTKETINQIERFLRGIDTDHIMDGEQIITTTRKVGQPLCNDKGIQQLLNIVSGVINPHVVQGNFTENEYHNYIADFRIDLARMLVRNNNEWMITKADREMIIVFITNLVKPFISRTKDNLERQSYNNTVKLVESNTIREQGKFKLMGGE